MLACFSKIEVPSSFLRVELEDGYLDGRGAAFHPSVWYLRRIRLSSISDPDRDRSYRVAGAVAATNSGELGLGLVLGPGLEPELPAPVQRAHEDLFPCLEDPAGHGPDMAEPAGDRDDHTAQPACSFVPELGQSRGLEAPALSTVDTPPGSAEAQDHFGVALAGTAHSEKNGADAGPYRQGFASRARHT